MIVSKRDKFIEPDDGTYVVKKSRKSSILAFIVCLLLAFVIWAYAEATDKQKQQAMEEIIDKAAETAQDE